MERRRTLEPKPSHSRLGSAPRPRPTIAEAKSHSSTRGRSFLWLADDSTDTLLNASHRALVSACQRPSRSSKAWRCTSPLQSSGKSPSEGRLAPHTNTGTTRTSRLSAVRSSSRTKVPGRMETRLPSCTGSVEPVHPDHRQENIARTNGFVQGTSEVRARRDAVQVHEHPTLSKALTQAVEQSASVTRGVATPIADEHARTPRLDHAIIIGARESTDHGHLTQWRAAIGRGSSACASPTAHRAQSLKRGSRGDCDTRAQTSLWSPRLPLAKRWTRA
jgi:hypothetical protein